ncbi:MAG: chemotaxis protein [Oscillospiraceae bacterium]|nr:chemotaxis protein [Oscillospiraceae bacterium]
MEFTVAGQNFGINVAKVRRILNKQPLKPMQNAHPVIEGIFKDQDKVITLIDLAQYLSLPPSDENSNERDIYIITDFNKLTFAFHVHTVEGIRRISWRNIQKPDRIIYGGDEGIATGIAEYEGRLITILDFEKIIMEINPETGFTPEMVDNMGPRETRADVPILVAEDSMLLAKLLVNSLNRAGYTNVIRTDNGAEAWQVLMDAKATGDPLGEHIRLVVTDIEMPQMDGHRLTKLIKEDRELRKLPVILFSSLINREMYLKGQQLGADAQITKPEIENLVTLVDELLEKAEV